MPETPTAAELVIPNDVRYAAYDTLLSARASGVDLGQAAAQVLAAVAGPVVAAELRRIADWHWDDNPTAREICDALQARADQLDPTSSSRQEDCR